MDDDFEAKMRLLEARSEEQDYEKLKLKVDRLTLLCQALWHFVRQHQELSEEELTAYIEELKKKDEKTENCSRCGRVMNKNQHRCLYCGSQAQTDSYFDTL
ncbi:MAG: hypothetical protein V2I97_12535 [Desulfococcaceae bacterium]|jgi:hypothetical protein|nr:hypothetical protein [Desulfococcaceae bacterium]